MVSFELTFPPPPERRGAPRRQPALRTVCRLATVEGAAIGLGLVCNLSTGGVSMLLNERLEPDTTLRAELRTVDDSSVLPLTLRVAHVSRMGTGDYVIGGQFQRPLEPDDMRPFLG